MLASRACGPADCVALGQSYCQSAPAPGPAPTPQWQSFWTWHIISSYFTGVANKDTANELCEAPFIAYYCLGQDQTYSAYNSEEHVENNVIEYIQVWVQGFGQYISCCPPYSKAGGTNTGDYYRCNAWTTDANDNCHTPNLPWNDEAQGVVYEVGAKNPPGAGTNQWMYSFPAEGEGQTWKQGLSRRIYAPDLANAWRKAAGGCPQCGASLEDGCVGKCLSAQLSSASLLSIYNAVAGDLANYPNHGVTGAGAIFLDGHNAPSYCFDLAGGDSSWKTPIDVWPCNGLVNQQFEWINYAIILAGSNNPGKCIDLPGGNAKNGVTLWLWAVSLAGEATCTLSAALPPFLCSLPVLIYSKTCSVDRALACGSAMA